MADFGPLVDAGWLAEHLDEVRIVDVRWYLDGRFGRAAYDAGHLPGAVWLDVDADLSEPASPEAGRHPLARPERFAAALGRVGIGAGTPVVAYDDAGGSVAARLWWMLHVLGEPVAVLDGGIDVWNAAPLEIAEPHVTPVQRAAQPWPAARFRTADQVEHRGSAMLLDARARARYDAGDPAIDPRPGHIPGALSAPWADNLDGGRFRPAADLAQRLPGGEVIVYCGSGVTACHDLLALELAGVGDTALYPGSFSQWGNDPSRPVEAT